MSKQTKSHSPPAKTRSTSTGEPLEGFNDVSSLSPSQAGIPTPDIVCEGSECTSTIGGTHGETQGDTNNGNAVAKSSPSEGPVLGVVVGSSEGSAPSSSLNSSLVVDARPGESGKSYQCHGLCYMDRSQRLVQAFKGTQRQTFAVDSKVFWTSLRTSDSTLTLTLDTEAQPPLGSSPPGLALQGSNGSHFVPYVYLCRCAYACAYSILRYMIHQEMSRLESLRYADDDAVVPLGGCLALLRQTLDADHEEADSIRRDVQALQVQAKWLAHQCEMVEQRQKNLAAKAGLPRKK